MNNSNEEKCNTANKTWKKKWQEPENSFSSFPRSFRRNETKDSNNSTNVESKFQYHGGNAISINNKSHRNEGLNGRGVGRISRHHQHHQHHHHQGKKKHRHNHKETVHNHKSLKWVKEDSLQHSNLVDSLQATLESDGNVFEDSELSQKRRNTLNELEHILCEWAKSIAETNGSSSQIVRLISFGSYRLGVHSRNSDLDVLAVCPSYISRDDFFSSFVDVLKKDVRVKGLHPIPGAYTPVIKCLMNELKIDLLFVRLADSNRLTRKANVANSVAQEREEFIIDDSMLIGLDEPSVRSLNGVRVVQYLLDTIPNKRNFRIVLRTVKQWANCHGLYSNVLGFLGGVNWAILVAWVCKRNSSASPPMLLKLFFQTFSRWRWPSPVTLSSIIEQPPRGVMKLSFWNPKSNPRDRAHIMPIITPVYPSMNSSYNVGKAQIRRLQEELLNGDRIMNQIIEGRSEWSDLLKGNDFFKRYNHYLEVSIISTNGKDHCKWFGLCESRLRILIAGFESPNHGSSAYPFAKFFTRKIQSDVANNNKIVTSFFIALHFSIPVDTIVDLRSCTQEFVIMANSWEERKIGMDLTINHVLQNDLPDCVFHGGAAIDLENLEVEDNDVESKGKDPNDFIVVDDSSQGEKRLRGTLLYEKKDDKTVAFPWQEMKDVKKDDKTVAFPCVNGKKKAYNAVSTNVYNNLFASPLKKIKVSKNEV